MATVRKGVILVGHGGIPRGCPQDMVTKLKRLEAQRRAAKQPASAEEMELDAKIRQWPRNAETDPYQAGLEAVAAQLRAKLGDVLFAVPIMSFVRRRWRNQSINSRSRVRPTLPWRPRCLRPAGLTRKWRSRKFSNISGLSTLASSSGMPGRLTLA